MESMETLYVNGDILTLEDNLYEEAILVKNGKIEQLGTKKKVESYASKDCKIVDLKGKTLMPAFIDAHSHFSAYANSFSKIDLKEASDYKEIADAIKAFIKKNHPPKGQWLQGEGYDQNHLKEKAHPTLELLDQAALDNPLLVQHASGHMGVFNSMALKMLGITTDTKSPIGGKIGQKDGRLTGYVEEAAFMNYIQQIPMISQEEFFHNLMWAQDAYAGYGITTVQEGFVVEQLVPILQYLMQSKQLRLDLIGFLDASKGRMLKTLFPNCIKSYVNHVKIGGYKTFLDGSPQGRTAWMRTPYAGTEDYYAYGTQNDEEFKQRIKLALEDHMQLLVHCNGDAACQQYLTCFQQVCEETKLMNDIRPVMIHAQLLDRDQLHKVKQLHMIPSFFVAHVYYWGDVHIKNFGLERAKRISLAASAKMEGIPFTFHQDAPVIEPDMIETIWCAVNRVTKKGVCLGEDEKIQPIDAIKAVTKYAAYQYFEENEKGTLKKGKLADMVILDQNILKVEPMDIRKIQILETIKEGQTIYKK